ncbi:MAG: DNA polymerase III subunit delta [Planctomycetota bacterium]|jgi:DNA polymerase-3 subunit delta
MSAPKTKKGRAAVYVIAGEDEPLVNAECDKLLHALIEPGQRATCLFDADPKEVEAADVFDELRTVPFLGDKRVVLIKKAGSFISDKRQFLEDYFDKPSPTGILILTVNKWDARTRLAKKLPEVGKLISVTPPKAWQLPPRLIKYARDGHDKTLSKEAAELLIELAGDELPRLYSEIDKLASYVDAEKTITPEHVEKVIGHNRLFNAFGVIDAVTAGRTGQAIDRLRSMFAQDKSAEYTTVGAFAFHFRRMFNAKVLLEKNHRPDEIADRLRIWGNRGRFFSQLQRMPLKRIGDVLVQLAEIDYAIKTGRTKAQVAIEQLVLKLAAPSA